MKINHYIQANRESWNQVASLHAKAKEEQKKRFMNAGYSCLDQTVTSKLKSINITGRRVAHLCCNDGMETLSLKNLGASACTGFDFSDKAIQYALQLATQSGISCRFVQANIYEIDECYDNQFDLVYISSVSLMWFPDLSLFFQTVHRLLAPDGIVMIYDIHPLLLLLDEKDKVNPLTLKYDYFLDEPRVFQDGLDYVSQTTYTSTSYYNFDPTLSQIMSAIIQNQLSIHMFEEYPHDISALFAHLANQNVQIPASYLLTAQKTGLS
ncbi:class I SAM-dependent methyltransferase [Hazenella sp. IB182357]|uniref:Class I SAM-dependent methyltransferase n=1 Tax=Polycladospora coralii TaxID=2771432 RepID=A0A926NC26_9BACL|nr:class I SAM-dependent methyltransferase [Polycladospora coralii]MBD1372635.1 class I SAM-dependent methyltransferase [Polycladospora coralii]MBS7531257.1 class I SAM-dependent methyltransferase [Polycladospora coralii]